MESQRKPRRGRRVAVRVPGLTPISETRRRATSPAAPPPKIAFLLNYAGLVALEEGDWRLTNSTSSSEDIDDNEHHATETTNRALLFIQAEAARVENLVGLYDNIHYM